MSKFLDSIEFNTPERDVDLITSGKRALQRFLFNKGLKGKEVEVKPFEDTIIITIDDGSKVKLEVKDYIPSEIPVEDGESDIEKTAKTAAAVLSIPEQGMKGLIPGSAASKVQKAKKALADKLVRAANSIEV